MKAALTFFRVIAYVVGVFLLGLTAGVIQKRVLGAGDDLIGIFGFFHGFLYMVYLVAALNLGIKSRWDWWYILRVMLAGTIPFLSFVAERRVTRRVQRESSLA